MCEAQEAQEAKETVACVLCGGCGMWGVGVCVCWGGGTVATELPELPELLEKVGRRGERRREEQRREGRVAHQVVLRERGAFVKRDARTADNARWRKDGQWNTHKHTMY